MGGDLFDLQGPLLTNPIIEDIPIIGDVPGSSTGGIPLGGKSDGSSIPQFIVDALSSFSGRSQQAFDASSPAIKTGAGQIQDIQSTGGQGANVPIIRQAQQAQDAATSNAVGRIGEAGARGGIDDQFTRRQQTATAQNGGAASSRIQSTVSAPIVQAGIQTGLTGTAQGAGGLSAALQNLARGITPNIPAASRQNFGSNVIGGASALQGQNFGGAGKGQTGNSGRVGSDGFGFVGGPGPI